MKAIAIDFDGCICTNAFPTFVLYMDWRKAGSVADCGILSAPGSGGVDIQSGREEK